MTIRVFLLDDHEIVRRGVRQLLDAEDDIEVVGEAGSAAEATERVAQLRPDVAVLDVQLGDGTGIEVARGIASEHPGIRCLMLTSFADDEAMFDSVVAGAAGYVLKDVKGNELIDAIRRVSKGESLLDPAMTTTILARLRQDAAEDTKLASLTKQEHNVLELLTEGLTNREIADRLFLAEKTVKNYVSNLLMKLDMRRRTEAAVYAARQADRKRHR